MAMGRAAATGVGMVAGAAVGDSVEGRGNYAQNVPQCSTQTSYENRTVGFNVVYEYAGKEYSVQMPYDPGQTIRLQLTPMGSSGAAPGTAMAPSGPSQAQPVIVAPPMDRAAGQPVAQIISAAPQSVYPAYPAPYYAPAYYAPAYYGPAYGAPYFYPPIGLSLSFGYSGGYRHHRGHWR